MADDVTITGGKYDITIKNAVSEADDDVTGDTANITNMALARGLWFQWEYTVQIELHTGEVEDDLLELGLMREIYDEVSVWTPLLLENPAEFSAQLNQLFQWNAGTGLTQQASRAEVGGPAGVFDWPPQTTITAILDLAPPLTDLPQTEPVLSWSEMQANPGGPEINLTYQYEEDAIYQSADGVYFRAITSGPTPVLVEIQREEIALFFDSPIIAGDADIAKARRELEAVIETRTQRNQEKQLQLQDLTAALQRWFTFTTNVDERKKRDADGIVGNFH